jgi:2,4-dienoyl-CoA reductase-like NADH-dependent reductase (Old Yellow Enzyme family)
VVDQCIAAVVLAREAGADGVDIKSCHGYLGGELLRPKNRRADRYGGTPENRARYICSVIREIKRAYPDFLVGTRVSLYEGIRGGCGTAGPEEVIEDLSDILDVLSFIVDTGADFINVSAGIPALTPGLTRPTVKGDVNLYHHFRYAKAVKDRFGQVAVFGSAYSAARDAASRYAEENIKKGHADFAGFGRQNLADPLFAKKIFSGSGEIDYCTLCGGCSRLLKEQKAVFCTVYGGNRVRGGR